MTATKKKPSVPVITARNKTTKPKATKQPEPIKYPIVKKGSHLTVITHETGKVELLWDDEALLRDVRNALAKVN